MIIRAMELRYDRECFSTTPAARSYVRVFLLVDVTSYGMSHICSIETVFPLKTLHKKLAAGPVTGARVGTHESKRNPTRPAFSPWRGARSPRSNNFKVAINRSVSQETRETSVSCGDDHPFDLCYKPKERGHSNARHF